MHPVAVLWHLRPQFAYMLDHYGRSRSRRWVSVRCGEAHLYMILVRVPGIRYIRVSCCSFREVFNFQIFEKIYYYVPGIPTVLQGIMRFSLHFRLRSSVRHSVRIGITYPTLLESRIPITYPKLLESRTISHRSTYNTYRYNSRIRLRSTSHPPRAATGIQKEFEVTSRHPSNIHHTSLLPVLSNRVGH